MSYTDKVRRAISRYRKYINSGKERRDFTAQELTAVRETAKADGLDDWSLITCSLMYGYVKGYRQAQKDREAQI